MSILRATIERLLLLGLVLAIGLGSLDPRALYGSPAPADENSCCASPSPCCCGMEGGETCGMACCQDPAPAEKPVPPTPQRTDDHGQKLVHTLESDSYRNSSSLSTRHLSEESLSAFLSSHSLIELSVRLNT